MVGIHTRCETHPQNTFLTRGVSDCQAPVSSVPLRFSEWRVQRRTHLIFDEVRQAGLSSSSRICVSREDRLLWIFITLRTFSKSICSFLPALPASARGRFRAAVWTGPPNQLCVSFRISYAPGIRMVTGLIRRLDRVIACRIPPCRIGC